MTCQFHNTPFFVPRFQFPGLTLGGIYNYPNYTWQDTYSGRAEVNWHLGQARDQIRRRVSAGQGHQDLGPEPARHLRVQQDAVDGRTRGAASRPTPGTTRRPGTSAASSRTCRSSTSTSTRTTSSIRRGRRSPCGSATTGGWPTTCRSRSASATTRTGGRAIRPGSRRP